MDDAPVFPDKSHPPTPADLAGVLGKALRYWEQLRDHGLALDPAAAPEWKYYTKKSGWSFLLRGRRRNLLYMRPLAPGRFGVSFAFSEKAVAAAEDADLPADVIAGIRAAPQYPEGRLVRVEVTSAAHARVAVKLLDVRAAS